MSAISIKGITARNQRLYDYLLELGLQTEDFSFGDTYGQLKAEHYDTEFFSPVLDQDDDVHNDVDAFPKQLLWDHTKSKTMAQHDYVLHLIVKNFSADLSIFLVQLSYWLYQEKQDQRIDYKLTRNNNNSVDLNLYLEIEERTTLTNQDGGTRKTC